MNVDEWNCNLDFEEKLLRVSFKKDLLSGNRVEWDNYTEAFIAKLKKLPKQWHTLVIDLIHIEAIHSLGLNFLVSIIRYASSLQVEITILVSNQRLRNILNFTGIAKHVNITQINS